MTVILGIDQGSSATRAVICGLDGRLLGFGKAPGGYHLYTGMARAMAVVQEAAAAALAQAHARQEDIRQNVQMDFCLVFGGFTGADWADEYVLLQKNVSAALGIEEVYITNDSIIAMRGGSQHPYGAILIAGSGANCAIRSPDGREYIYGYYHDAHLQGGGALGRQALDAIYRAETGRKPATRLTGRVLTFYNLKNVDDLLRAEVEHRLPGAGPRDLAPLVFEEASQGDPAAARILQDFGQGCAELVVNGLERFAMTGLAVEVVLSGSIFKGKGSLLIDTLTRHIQQGAPQARLRSARYEPVVGAALLGLEKAGVAADQAVNSAIEETAQALGLVRSHI
jgi:N-acetylglucosamine kinase-like BadF-type ATPase